MPRNVTTIAAVGFMLTLAISACSPKAENNVPSATTTTSIAETSETEMKAVLDRHIAAVKGGNVDAVMADYADDATLVMMPGDIAPKGALAGKAQVRKFFEWLRTPEVLPGAQSMTVTTEKIGPNTMSFNFTQFPGKANQVKGFDIYVFRGGKILFQTTFVNP